MRISESSHHLKRTSLWSYENQVDAVAILATPDILNRASATIRASLGVNTPQSIWDALGHQLHSQLLLLKAVSISNFASFGLNENNELVFVQDPVFLHMTRLCLASRKRRDLVVPALRHNTQVVGIELDSLAAGYLQNCSKDLVKSVMSSIFAWVTSWAKDGHQMRLSFLPVGEWICDGESVDFCFSDIFVQEIESKKAKEKLEAGMTMTHAGGGKTNSNEQDPVGDQICSPSTAAASEGKDLSPPKQSITINTVSSAAKVDALETKFPVRRSRYKLREPTYSSIAKQLPPHGQICRKRTGTSARTASTSRVKLGLTKTSSTDRGSNQTPRKLGSVSLKSNPVDIKSAATGILSTVKNVRMLKIWPCKNTSYSDTSKGLTMQQQDTLKRLLKRISNRKGQTMQGLNAVVVALQPFKTGAVSSTGLSLSLRKIGVKVSSSELKDIAAAFSHEKRGYIDIIKFIDALRGPPLCGTRLDLVAKAFHLMDPARNGVVSVDEMIKYCDVGFFPEVREGKQSKLEALTAFLQEWASVCTSGDNMITFDMFVSVCIEKHTDFERLIHRTWRQPEGTQGSESEDPSRRHNKTNSSNLSSDTSKKSYTQSDFAPENLTGTEAADIKNPHSSKAWSYLRELLLLPQPYKVGAGSWPTLDTLCRRLGANRVLGDGNEKLNVKAFAHALATLDKHLTQKDAYDLSCFVADHCATALDGDDTIVLLSLYRILINEKTTTDSSVDYNNVEYYASRAIARILERIKGTQTRVNTPEALPPMDLKKLEKWLQVFCSNGDSYLSKCELRSAIMKVGIDVSYQDLDYLFAYFDIDRQSHINYVTFLDALRSPSSMLPKLAQLQEKTPSHSQLNAGYISSAQQFALDSTASQHAAHRKKQIAPREPQPNFRRRNLIHRAIWDQTMKTVTDTGDKLAKLEIERRRRYHAAQIIQTTFRAFRARHIAAQLRRKTAAKMYSSHVQAQEHLQLLIKKKMNRTALPTAYGF
ncbi:unnamed protein product [Phytophthora fragariaefolia]|uniref:Unnamed protein product n=1 Tax=Phytophthora fragariaefolia TaxID=1490495 RepID=A0A9W6XJ13_9STRA|nr:unnamed protein product [Phytophthora fragariaefolia]